MTKVIPRRPVAPPPPKPKPKGAVESPLDKWMSKTDLGLFHGGRKEVVIGIDASANGHAIFALCPHDLTAHGWLYKQPLPSKGGPDGVNRLLILERYLRLVFENIRMQTSAVLHIVMEQYSFSRQMGHLLGEVGGLTKLELCHVFGSANIVSYPTFPAANQLKLFTTGSGSSDKNLMLKSAYKKWGVDLDDDNLCDAYAASRWAACIVTDRTEFQYEADVVAKVGRHLEWGQKEPSTR